MALVKRLEAVNDGTFKTKRDQCLASVTELIEREAKLNKETAEKLSNKIINLVLREVLYDFRRLGRDLADLYTNGNVRPPRPTRQKKKEEN